MTLVSFPVTLFLTVMFLTRLVSRESLEVPLATPGTCAVVGDVEGSPPLVHAGVLNSRGSSGRRSAVVVCILLLWSGAVCNEGYCAWGRAPGEDAHGP